MSLAWSRLVEIQQEIPASELGVGFDTPVGSLSLVGESPQALDNCRFRDWFKIGTQQFLHTSHNEPHRFVGFAWAPSDGAFARALTGDAYFDDDARQLPPPELLPDRRSSDYESVVRLGRELAMQHFHDYDGWALVREVSYDRFTFYFRHSSLKKQEPPFCIKILPFWREDDHETGA